MRIFLTGFMGSGKSHWGKLWAVNNNLAFYDLDEVIENAEQRPVLEIFEKKGEEYFRFRETMLLRTMKAKNNCIIACGGGAACFDGNINWMNENGLTIYISATPNQLLENIMKEKDKRPLLTKIPEAELLFFIEQKLKERLPFYLQATHIMDINILHEESLNTIAISPE